MGEAGLLLVDAGQDENRRPGSADMIDRRLQVAVPTLKALEIQLSVVILQRSGEGGNTLGELGIVRLADHEMGTGRAIDGHVARTVGELGRALVV